jgi:tRNA-Thr(GGU) m(6)t(6)A37 methyltransferase TsaA
MLRGKEIKLSPIGFVRRKDKNEDVKDRTLVCSIVVKKSYEKALEGIENFSHIYIISWMHKIGDAERNVLKTHPRGRVDIPLMGVFATRSPLRPNPIGLTIVELLERKGSVLAVKGLDAFDGTPILDVKPYDHWDMIENVKVPEWWLILEKEKKGGF